MKSFYGRPQHRWKLFATVALLLFVTPSHASSNEVCRASVRPQQWVQITPTAKPKKVLPELFEELIVERGIPRIVFDEMNPFFEELLALGPVPPTHQDPDTKKAVLNLLKMFNLFSESTTVFLSGNGQYRSYLILKTLFEGTAMADRFVYLPLSRGITDEINQPTGPSLERFYSFLKIEQRKGNFLVFDSVSELEKPNQHSVQQVAHSLRKFLLKKGEGIDSIRNRVVPVAVAEIPNVRQTYLVDTLEEFRAGVNDLTIEQVEKEEPDFPVPMVLSRVMWREGVQDGYNGSGDKTWAGKYSELDSEGFPRSDQSIEERIPLTYRHEMQKRKELIEEYLKLIGSLQKYLAEDAEVSGQVKEIIRLQGG